MRRLSGASYKQLLVRISTVLNILLYVYGVSSSTAGVAATDAAAGVGDAAAANLGFHEVVKRSRSCSISAARVHPRAV